MPIRLLCDASSESMTGPDLPDAAMTPAIGSTASAATATVRTRRLTAERGEPSNTDSNPLLSDDGPGPRTSCARRWLRRVLRVDRPADVAVHRPGVQEHRP